MCSNAKTSNRAWLLKKSNKNNAYLIASTFLFALYGGPNWLLIRITFYHHSQQSHQESVLHKTPTTNCKYRDVPLIVYKIIMTNKLILTSSRAGKFNVNFVTEREKNLSQSRGKYQRHILDGGTIFSWKYQFLSYLRHASLDCFSYKSKKNCKN